MLAEAPDDPCIPRPAPARPRTRWRPGKLPSSTPEMADLRGRGVTFEEYDLPGLKSTDGVAEFGRLRGAWFKDSEGNILGVTEMRRE
jgi:hypothetical protein